MNASRILLCAWTAVVIVYAVLAFIASKRLRGRQKTLNHIVLLVIAVLVAVQIWIHHAFRGPIDLLAGFSVGMVAGIAALIVAKTLMSQESDDEGGTAGSEEIQILKLS